MTLSFNVKNVHQAVQRKIVHMWCETVGVYDSGHPIGVLNFAPIYDQEAVILAGEHKPEHMTGIEITFYANGRDNILPPQRVVPLLVERDSLMAEIGFLIARSID